jgi:hypothetical protein
MTAYNQLVQIKLLRRPGFTGTFGNYRFEDGVSEPMVRREAERLAAVTTVEFVNSDSMWERKRKERGVLSGKIKADTQVGVAPEPAEPVEVPKPSLGQVTYSREDLELIADKSGIQGLREIATPIGIKGVQIPAMIRAILAYQEAKLRGE